VSAPKAAAPQPKPAPEASSTPASPPGDSQSVPLPQPRPAEPAAESTPQSQGAPTAPPGENAAPPPASAPSSASTGNEPAGQSHAPRVFQTACPAVVMGEVEAEAKPPIEEQQCVARSPLTLTGVMVNGHEVAIQGGVTSDCAMASMLPVWLGQVDGYLWSRLNTRLKSISVGTSFMCRDRRTGEPNDTLSEHAFADAMDVTSFTLQNGKTISVSSNWMPADDENGRMLRFTHNAACSLFMTTLGPEANALHHDHFHIDMGCHGKTCTFRMCE
jgi:hypothetical protein